jgi:hypothetical protein
MLLVALAGAVAVVPGCGSSSERSVAAEITALDPPSGALRTGNPATVSVRVKNTGSKGHTL